MSLYPGLKSNEALLWEAFLRQYAKSLPVVATWFDVVTGGWLDEGVDKSSQREWEEVQRYGLRIDVILELPRELILIEIAPKVGKCEFGGLMLYRASLIDDFEKNNPVPCRIQGNSKWVTAPLTWKGKQVNLAALCLYIRESYKTWFEEAGITVYTVIVPELENKIRRE